MNRTLLIGQAPSRSGADRFEGRSGRRLAILAGLSDETFRATFDRENLLPALPPSSGRGDAFPTSAARTSAVDVASRLTGRRVVFVGLAVARAFRFEIPVFTWAERFGAIVAVTPHPSGLNLFWNDPANVRAATAFWRSVARLSGVQPAAEVAETEDLPQP